MSKLPRNLSSVIDQVARAALGKDWGVYAGLIERWSEIVGPDFARETTPVKITFPRGKKSDEKWATPQRGGGVLTIRLPHGLQFTFSHQTPVILARLNNYFGHEAFSKIAFDPFYPKADGPLPVQPRPVSMEEKRTLEEATVSIDNNELREALAALGASVLANQKRV